MSVFGSNGKDEPLDSAGGMGPESLSDPIARNPKDIDGANGSPKLVSDYLDLALSDSESQENAVAAQVSRRGPAAIAPVVSPWPPSSSPTSAPSATELLLSVLRYKWTILLIFILVSAPIIAAVWTQVVPEYRARAEIRVRPIIPRLVFNTDDNGAIPFYDSFVNTQVSIIRSLTVLNRVLEQEDVQQTQWYRDPPQSLKDRLSDVAVPPMERLRDSLSVRPRPRTEIIDVSFTDTSASDAKVIVNAALDQYVRYTGEKSSATDDLIYRQLTDKKGSLEDGISGREQLLARLEKQLGTALPEQLISAKRVHLDGLQSRLSELQQSIAILEWEIARTQVHDSNDAPVVTTAEAEKQRLYHEDVQWLALDRNVRILEHQMGNSIYGPKHPERLRLVNDMDFAKNELERRKSQLDEQWKNRAITAASVPIIVNDPNRPMYAEGPGSLQHQLARARHEEDGLLADLTKQQKVFEEAFATAQMLKSESSHLRHERELYDAVRTRLDEKNMERNVPGSIEILMGAFSPSRPSKDRRVVFTAMALFVGFGMGGGAAFLRASRNQAIHSARDIPQPAQVPFLGNIPLVQTRKAPGKSLCDEIERNQFRLFESVRVLRTALLSRLSDQDIATVLVTSADEGTGKSSFTMMLGKSIAQAGRKVLVVDTDFHKMSLSKRFDVLGEPGLIEALKNKARDQLPVIPTNTSGLDILPAGKHCDGERVYEEIANGAFKACLSRLRQDYQYDVILFDSAPLLPVADAAILAGQVDGAIMVEREDLSQRTHVASALTRLHSAGGRLLGTVFIGSSGPQDYGRGYGYGYGYHRSKTEKP